LVFGEGLRAVLRREWSFEGVEVMSFMQDSVGRDLDQTVESSLNSSIVFVSLLLLT
jgi:hypothetical protein